MIRRYSKETLIGKTGWQKNSAPNPFVSIHCAQYAPTQQNRASRKQEQSRVVRSLLQDALKKTTGCNHSANWSVEKTEDGKPFLSGAHAPAISLSHSANWVACAIAQTTYIGIDIEAIRERDWLAYSLAIFSQAESKWVLGGTKKEQNIRGLVCWCRKEALLKAMGIGNTVSMADIAFTPEGTLITLPEQLGSPSGWTSHTDILPKQAVVATVWKN